MDDQSGKTNTFGHSWPEIIDPQELELSSRCLHKYVKWHVTGQMWSRCPSFASGFNQIRIINRSNKIYQPILRIGG